jgi:hypothetical protein
MSNSIPIQMPTETSPFYCNMNAMTAAQRVRHSELWQQLESARLELQELDNGLAFRYPPERWSDAAEFVSFERLCCPFFHFILELEPENGSVWLRLIGAEGVKQFLMAELNPR